MALSIRKVVYFGCQMPRMLSVAVAPKTGNAKEKVVTKKAILKIEPKGTKKPDNIVIQWPPGNNAAAFLSWHPEPQHPYEHTLSVQRDAKRLAVGEFIVRQEYIDQATADHVRRVTRSHGPNWKTLANVFNDDWHQFRPTPRQSATKDLLPVPPPEREGELPR